MQLLFAFVTGMQQATASLPHTVFDKQILGHIAQRIQELQSLELCVQPQPIFHIN